MTAGSLSFCTDFAFDCGSWMSTPRFKSGAVTMKMINKTSITSIYGTTLISALSLWRLRCLPRPCIRRLQRIRACDGVRNSTRSHHVVHVRLTREDRGEFLDERVVAHADAFELGCEAVVEPDRRNGGEETHRGGDQRFGNAG